MFFGEKNYVEYVIVTIDKQLYFSDWVGTKEISSFIYFLNFYVWLF